MKILIDNGHGRETPGKRSPDGSIQEYKWAREIASRIVSELRQRGLDAERIVPEEGDVSLRERTRRVNAFCHRLGANNVLLISVHINAAGADGNWHTATGWSCWVAPNASRNSKYLARLLYDAADARGLRGNRSVPSSRYWVGNFAIVRDSDCPAVLTENLFQDNEQDVAYLLSEHGKQTIVEAHVEGIVNYINSGAE